MEGRKDFFCWYQDVTGKILLCPVNIRIRVVKMTLGLC